MVVYINKERFIDCRQEKVHSQRRYTMYPKLFVYNPHSAPIFMNKHSNIFHPDNQVLFSVAS